MSDIAESFVDVYLAYRRETESPYNYHRWCAITGVGTVLGRNFYLQFGDNRIYTNLYTMLVGESGSRKSVAIRGIKKILLAAGYPAQQIAADRTTKEKFLLDLQGETEDLLASTGNTGAYDKTTEQNLWGSEAVHDGEPRCILVAADEFNDFIGINNLDFCSMLGQLWDYEGVYQSRIKNGKSVAVPDPTISILAGNTAQNIASAFPPEIIGQGFLSRLLFIHGEISDRKYTIPPTPKPEDTETVTNFLKKIQSEIRGDASVEPDAYQMLDTIYKGWSPLPDVRFRNYSTRRFTQLLKLTLILAAGRLSKTITCSDVVRANTYLSAAEHNMPKALGEFGRGRHSAVSDKIIRVLSTATKPLGIKELWKEAHKDLDKPQDLAIVIQSLEQADKIFQPRNPVDNKPMGWLLKKEKKREERFVDWTLLTEEERKLL